MSRLLLDAASSRAIGGAILAAFLSATLASSATAQGSAATRFPNFAPDPTVGWLSSGTEYIPMDTGPRPVTYDPKYPYVPNGRGEQPTFRVADLSNPILQPWVRDELKKWNDRTLAGKDAFPPQVRCWPLGVPAFVLYPAQPVYIVQTDKEVLLTWQADHMIRRVRLSDQHADNPKPTWFGDSIGHYENGDTLVIDTIGITTKTVVDNYRTPHTDQLHVVERWKLTNADTRIEVTVTVEDPGAFTTPWSAKQIYRRTEIGPMAEATRVEGNINYFGFDLEPLPEDTTPDF